MQELPLCVGLCVPQVDLHAFDAWRDYLKPEVCVVSIKIITEGLSCCLLGYFRNMLRGFAEHSLYSSYVVIDVSYVIVIFS